MVMRLTSFEFLATFAEFGFELFLGLRPDVNWKTV